MAPYFQKRFDTHGLGLVDYWRCARCGFVLSKTHREMSPLEWERLNRCYHLGYQGSEANCDDPRWLHRIRLQAEVIRDLEELGLVDRSGQWLDFACGDGKLSAELSRDGLKLMKFDPYAPQEQGYLAADALRPGAFDLVISTSVFEHLTRREDYERINTLVGHNGALGVHTLVCETVPADPDWFYLLPVHTAFLTNRSMQHLFRSWGYSSSIYQVEARLWFWFRRHPLEVGRVIESANRRDRAMKYVYKNAFVDYWK